jgi:mono/diheme cytochrome c family protein
MKSVLARLAAVISFLLALAIFAAGEVMAQAVTPAKTHAIEQGRRLFNSNCSHCHGEDAAAEDSFYNLPQLLSDRNEAFFFATVSRGIPDKGMPPWKGVLKRREMADILTFLRALEQKGGALEKGSGNN